MAAARRVRRELGAVVPAAHVPPTREALLRLEARDASGNDQKKILLFADDPRASPSTSSSSYQTAHTTITTASLDSQTRASIVMQSIRARLKRIAERNRALHDRCFTRAVARRLQAESPSAESGTLACGVPHARPWRSP